MKQIVAFGTNFVFIFTTVLLHIYLKMNFSGQVLVISPGLSSFSPLLRIFTANRQKQQDISVEIRISFIESFRLYDQPRKFFHIIQRVFSKFTGNGGQFPYQPFRFFSVSVQFTAPFP